MASLTLKDIPDDLHAAARDAARVEGRSLNSYIIALMDRDRSERARRQRMRESRPDFQVFMNSLPRLSDSTELIREDRGQNS